MSQSLDHPKYYLAYEESVSLLKTLITKDKNGAKGFIASAENIDNYKRFFVRDIFWMGMASLMTGDADLKDVFRSSLTIMKNTQSGEGAIASNISLDAEVSYGKKSPRIDTTMLYIIACCEYYKYTEEKEFFREFSGSVEQAASYLTDKWEDENCGLIYIPQAGDWADEYFQQGFVLYDEVLWYMVLQSLDYLANTVGNKDKLMFKDKAERVKAVLRERFWVKNPMVREGEIFKNMQAKFDFTRMGYMIHFYFAKSRDEVCFPVSHGMFDTFGNALAIISGITTDVMAEEILKFMEEISPNKYPIIPAHYPFVHESTFKDEGQFQYRFKEFLGEYHNGGLWPWYMGVYVSGLVKRREYEKALKYLNGIMTANAEAKDGKNFYEYHTSRKATADVVVEHPGGLDAVFSGELQRIIKVRKPTIQTELRGQVVDVNADMCITCFRMQRGEKVKFIVVGPDAEDVLAEVVESKDGKGERYFADIDMVSIQSGPAGTPLLGVSAAAYIIGYKALTEDKVLFA